MAESSGEIYKAKRKTENQRPWLILMLVFSALLLLPSIVLLYQNLQFKLPISGNISEAWHDGLWQFLQRVPLNLSRKTVSILADGLSWLATGGLLLCYWQLLLQQKTPRQPEETSWTSGRVWAWCLGISSVLLAVVPFHSRDVYGYINRGVQQAFYGINPYKVAVGEMPGWQNDPVFQNHWVDNPCPYGFFYAKLAKGLAFLGGHEFWTSFLVFKVSVVLVHLGIVWLLYQFAIRLNRPSPVWLMALYALSPLVLLQQIANGHNDGFLALGLIGALMLLFQNRFQLFAWPTLLLSVLTKYSSLLAAPFMLVYAIRKREWKNLAAGSLIALSLLLAFAFCYLQDWQHMPWDRMAENAGKSQHSIQAALARVVYYLALPFTSNAGDLLEMTRSVLKKIFLFGFSVFYGVRVWRFWQNSLDNEKIRDRLLYEVALTMSVYLLLASAKFHAWYLGMILPVVFLLNPDIQKHRRLMLAVFWVSVFQLLAFTPLENIHIVGPLLLIVLPICLSQKKIRPKNAASESQFRSAPPMRSRR
ncbi:MAG: glycosyltransferase 87 family protein [Vampirovibrionales bacterium]|nr:glycosyltransferase 87 family protein [Vampirovibrionales bacterium]